MRELALHICPAWPLRMHSQHAIPEHEAQHAQDAHRGPLDRLLDVRVVEHDVRALPAELERDTLEVPCGARGEDAAARRDTTREGHLAHGGVLDERLPRRMPEPGQHAHDAWREAREAHELRDLERAERRHLRRLQHHAVARRERGPELPRHDHHCGAVSGGADAGACATYGGSSRG